ncbi:hypothetical protein FRACYDRAFT_241380 [Fragilariopsis cylindrus CCMP1102]|uniref:LITAF domain-containing protein n=1 Tax=Fragilariopsis cylindrus CCMP1102 TaxID=635003 RepID=A0A1E7F9G1_9STRA|nr:hypothetical protein FRACYDRAFT_241380 [Fragilariopsis cylindrus CCMP1102]|eukprot:OEU14821.1 hypothetical protein FRACYDRAFT_241380 [Fragilariopsis cylindrus CCMP1102]
MGIFGKTKKDIPASPNGGGNYMQAPSTDIKSLPVATLVSTLVSEGPAPTAPYHSNDNFPSASAPTAPAPAPACGGCCSNVNRHIGNDDGDLTRFPMIMVECPHCHSESRTRVTTAPSWQTWASSLGLCFLFWPISWVPLVTDTCKTTEHFCVRCGYKVGEVKPFADCCVEKRG